MPGPIAITSIPSKNFSMSSKSSKLLAMGSINFIEIMSNISFGTILYTSPAPDFNDAFDER